MVLVLVISDAVRRVGAKEDGHEGVGQVDVEDPECPDSTEVTVTVVVDAGIVGQGEVGLVLAETIGTETSSKSSLEDGLKPSSREKIRYWPPRASGGAFSSVTGVVLEEVALAKARLVSFQGLFDHR
jgi:hypothetical protein